MSAPEVTMLALFVSIWCPAPSAGDKGGPPSSKQRDQMMAPSDLETTMETLPFKPGRLTKNCEGQARASGRQSHVISRKTAPFGLQACLRLQRGEQGSSRHVWQETQLGQLALGGAGEGEVPGGSSDRPRALVGTRLVFRKA